MLLTAAGHFPGHLGYFTEPEKRRSQIVSFSLREQRCSPLQSQLRTSPSIQEKTSAQQQGGWCVQGSEFGIDGVETSTGPMVQMVCDPTNRGQRESEGQLWGSGPMWVA